MPYNFSDKNTDKELYKDVARLCGVHEEIVRKVWEDGFYEAIVRLIHFKGVVRLRHLGTFSTVLLNEQIISQPGPDGKMETYKVPAREKPVFTPHDDFINDMNFMGLTKAYRKRVKHGTLSQNDFRRQQRIAEFGEFGAVTKERLENIKSDFQKKLEGIVEEKEVGNDCQQRKT